jgi:hypothetical protein
VKAATTEAASAAEASTTTEARKSMIAFYSGCPAVMIASENAVVACIAALLKSR